MKKVTLLFILCLTMTTLSYSQCETITGGAWPSSVVTILNNGTAETIAADNWPNAEFSAIDGLIVGNTYTITGTNTSSLYITVAEALPDFSDWGTIITHGDATVSFTATTAQIFIFWHLDSLCGAATGDNTATTIQCTSATCTCTATAAPGAPTITTIADGATNVLIDITDPANWVIGDFAWTDGSGEIDTTNLSIGTDTAGINIGTIPGMTNGGGIQYANNWTYSTTYYWSLESINCFGGATSPVFSFTTEPDPLSTEDFENNNSISHFYNYNTDVLTLTSSTLPFNRIELYSILGQQILNTKLSKTNENINLSNLTDGIYIAKVSIDGKTESFKFVK